MVLGRTRSCGEELTPCQCCVQCLTHIGGLLSRSIPAVLDVFPLRLGANSQSASAADLLLLPKRVSALVRAEQVELR
ncbi:hypothetical protein HMPREF1979_01854 [Actinomyces johnsonii F0542]|uniref:Uncharacterized protein n=1 Tax=Actinomyces johnsonii F0542 TaxID=1321818 RepID=U1RUL4_9ACTO|nr:hypothetical protein HMPREF1979_01854 [Actinomyces johnsonii F0542]